MKFYLRPLLLLLFLLIIFSCETEDDELQPQIEIDSIDLLQNEKGGIVIEVKTSGKISEIIDHGLVWLQDDVEVNRLKLGPLKTNTFNATIRSGMRKGETYDVFAYVALEQKTISGDTIRLISEVEVEPKLFEITPRTGFIGDTITIRGQDFCPSRVGYVDNFLFLGSSYSAGIFESDSLFKAIIPSPIYTSEFELALQTCDTMLKAEGNFIIDKPVLDSIAPKLVYAGEELTLYGKNVHSGVSKLWLGGVEVPLISSNSVEKLVGTIPGNLPPGKLDLRLQVIDRTIERQDYYQSTSPVLEEVIPAETGFLDTITLKGKFLDQHSDKLEVLIGGELQRILEVEDESISVVIDQLFGGNNPELVLNTGVFSLKSPIVMLPPQITSIEDKLYHFHDQLDVETKYYLGSKNTIEIGGMGPPTIGQGRSEISDSGAFTLYLNDWFGTEGYNQVSFTFDKPGELKLKIETPYGQDSRNIKMAAPEITGLSAEGYLLGTPLEFKGTDFGYKGVSEIYIDGKLLEDPRNSTYSIRNYVAYFSIPTSLDPGVHTLKIVTGGQTSNTVEFLIRDIEVSSLSATTGTRRDYFTITGKNLENGTTYGIYADGKPCLLIEANENSAIFKLPQDQELDPDVDVILKYGKKEIEIGNISVTEPHHRIDGYELPVDYNSESPTFTYNDNFYFININGIYRFNKSELSWTQVESEVPEGLYFGSSRREVPVIGSKIYFAGSGSNLVSYDLQNRTWDQRTLNLESGSYMERISIKGNILIALLGNSNKFIRYDLSANEILSMAQPNVTFGNVHNLNLHHSGDYIFMDRLDGDLYMYNLETDSWKNIGFPTPYSYFYQNVLFYHEGNLYLSGGRGNADPTRSLYSYNLENQVWTEQVPTLDVLTDHAIFASHGKLFFLLGRSIYGYTNQQLGEYDISNDPY